MLSVQTVAEDFVEITGGCGPREIAKSWRQLTCSYVLYFFTPTSPSTSPVVIIEHQALGELFILA